jgi:hypothetical protein
MSVTEKPLNLLGIGGIVTEMTKDRSNEPATGNDLVRLANSIDLNFNGVSGEFISIRQEFVGIRQEFVNIRQEFVAIREEIAELRQDNVKLRNEMREFKLEIIETMNSVIIKFVVINTAFLSLVVAIGGIAIALA